MNLQQASSALIFGPRTSHGWVSLLFMSAVTVALAVAPALASGLSSVSAILTVVICAPIALGFLVLAIWFPSMRYELDRARLTLRYGPVLTYQIPLCEIRNIRPRNLSLTIWSSIRLPGIALFDVPYADEGSVKMCATAALNRILLIETGRAKFGLTPADEEQFVAALRDRMEV